MFSRVIMFIAPKLFFLPLNYYASQLGHHIAITISKILPSILGVVKPSGFQNSKMLGLKKKKQL